MTYEQDAELSRRSVQRTIRLTILVITALTGLILVCIRPAAAWPITTVIGVLVVGALLTEYFNREDRGS